jgi:hypothetical protein
MGNSSCRRCDGCPAAMPRRSFLAGTGMAGLMAALEPASNLFAQPKPPGSPRVEVVFVRPEVEPIVSWPGGNADVPAQQALFTRTLRQAASELNVRLDVHDTPLHNLADAAAFIERVRQSPPDGLLVGAMSLTTWEPVNEIVAKRGDNIPTIVYSHLSGFTNNLQCGRNTPRTFLAATQEVEWLARGLRMFNTIWRMRNTRILVVRKAGPDVTVQPWGTVLHPIDKARFAEVFAKVEDSAEVRAIAEAYAGGAERIVEPTRQEIHEAAKNYIACRRLMEAEHCQGISVDCLGWANPVCMSFSKLLDEGIVAGCEADPNAALSELLSIHLLNKPGFIQDPSPNTINNTLIGSHCTSALRLEGYASSYRAPYWVRSYHTRTGASLEVMWPVDKPVTVFQIVSKDGTMLAGTGRVRANIPQPPSGCCRTAVEIDVDRVDDTRDVKGFHQLFVLGREERMIQAYGRLAGIPVKTLA